MSNNQLFDNNIKEQFQDYSPTVHPRIWENIVKERKKRKPVGFWYTFFNGRNILLLTVLLLATGSGTYLLLKNSGNNNSNSTVNTSKNNIPPSSTNANSEKTSHGNTETIAATANQTPASSSLNNMVAGNGDDNTAGNHLFSSNGTNKIKIYSPFAQAGENDIVTSTDKKNRTRPEADNDDASTNIRMQSGNLTEQDFYLRRLLFADMEKLSSEKKTAALQRSFVPNIFLPGCPSIEKNAAGNKTYIEVYGGPDMAFRSLSDTGNSAYLQKRRESTKFSSAFSAGIRYTKVFNNGVSIRTGINFSQINEKFTFVQGNLVQITYIINANGDTTGSYITTGTRYKTTINKFRTVDVPILVGYEMGNGKFHANINAGVIVNAYSWQKGDVLDTAFRPVSITTGKTNSPYQFKTNIGMGFMVGASLYYKLNEKLHLMAEPYFRYNLSPMSNEKLTFTQKYNTAGVRVGLRLDLH